MIAKSDDLWVIIRTSDHSVALTGWGVFLLMIFFFAILLGGK